MLKTRPTKQAPGWGKTTPFPACTDTTRSKTSSCSLFMTPPASQANRSLGFSRDAICIVCMVGSNPAFSRCRVFFLPQHPLGLNFTMSLSGSLGADECALWLPVSSSWVQDRPQAWCRGCGVCVCWLCPCEGWDVCVGPCGVWGT